MNLGQLVPQGAELLQSYGDKPNATLLLDSQQLMLEILLSCSQVPLPQHVSSV